MAGPHELLLIAEIVFPIAVAIYVARRVYRLTYGVRLRRSLLALFSLLYIGLFAYSEIPEWIRFPVAATTIDAVLLVAGIALAVRFLRPRVYFELTAEGRWVYRASVVVLITWFVFFLARLFIEVAITGHIYLFGIPSARHLSVAYVLLLLSVDSLFAFSTGLLLGGNLGIFLQYRAERARVEGGVPRGASDPPSRAKSL